LVILRLKNQNESVREIVESKQKVAVVTGSSGGIGYATVLHLARAGYFTFATMRNPANGFDLIKAAEKENLPIQVEQLDVTHLDSIKGFMRRIGDSAARIDILVNNAGYVLIGSLEDLSIKEIQDQLDTNLLGVIGVTQQVLPIMRAQRSGIIVNISSGVGRFGFPGMSAYVSTKFALEGLSESLAYEVAPFGINVVLIEPGVVKTKILKNSVVGQAALREDSPYSGMLGSLNESFNTLLENASTSDQVAATILQAISSSEPKLRYPVGQDVNSWLEKKSTMTDEQFQEYMKNSMASVAPSQR
jgi:NAD(P)-dependent dehydrogenase (short-subunit alcohol dehydrogenase family)